MSLRKKYLDWFLGIYEFVSVFDLCANNPAQVVFRLDHEKVKKPALDVRRPG